MIILGIDPALIHTGWAIINYNNNKVSLVNSGITKPPVNSQIHLRLAILASLTEDIITKYNPSVIAVEESFVNVNAASSLKLGFARGAILSVIGKFPEVQFCEFKPNLIKKTVTGSGHATKEKMLQMVKFVVSGSEDLSDFNEADALAIAYTALIYTQNNKVFN